MSGVFVTSFEELSFFPGAAAIPDANHPLRFSQQIELDERDIERLAGPMTFTANGEPIF